MDDFGGKLAVITGGGTGMGRALARALVAEGCDVAMCDVSADNMAETARLCAAEAPQGIRVSTHVADVAERASVDGFRDAVVEAHGATAINLLFNNAGIGGGGSFIADPVDQWERTFNVCWGGVYNCSRAFVDLLVAADEAHMVNTSSINGFWASMGPGRPHTAYSAAKFAVRGFTEALINDLRVHAPHVGVSVVMPGHVGTSILINSAEILGRDDPLNMLARDELDDAGRAIARERARSFLESAPTSADEAARIILDGVRAKRWRILVGADAAQLDRLVRSDPEGCYDDDFVSRWSNSPGD